LSVGVTVTVSFAMVRCVDLNTRLDAKPRYLLLDCVYHRLAGVGLMIESDFYASALPESNLMPLKSISLCADLLMFTAQLRLGVNTLR
jgi:hypothetical protein